ncbi:putative glycosyl transferase [Raoultella terrigena]|uniref:Putative glycosyl transferase n=1 Tax=Raoultella terrigena TaxID=577 RepID=A0A3P8IUZ5_RAOTE|nr:putative glycosyl transferase [Raoultella terrigena]
MKKLDVILASYNGERYIKDQILSVLTCFEHVHNMECRILISDDSSLDNTVSVLQEICNHDSRVQLLDSDKKGGVKFNFHHLMLNTDADYIFFSDQDDYWLPEKINLFLNKMMESESENPGPVLVHSDLCVTDENLSPVNVSMFNYQNLNKTPSFTELLISNSVTGCVMACNKELIDSVKHGKIEESIMHDWYVALYASAFGRIEFIDHSMILYRQHSNNQVGAKAFTLKKLISSDGYKNQIKNARDSVYKTKAQAQLFYDDFGLLLNVSDKNILEKFISTFDGSFLGRLNLFLNKKIRKKGFLRNLVFFFIYVVRI